MASPGLHVALDRESEGRLLEAAESGDYDELVDLLLDFTIGAEAQETGTAWGAIHRCLTDGTLTPGNGEYPLNRCVLGGRQLYPGRDWTVSFVPAGEVRDLAAELTPIDETWLRTRYRAVPLPEVDWKDTWSRFDALRAFLRRTAAAGRSVVFVVSR
jgi:hypothetical protein